MAYGTKNKEATPGHSIAKLRMRRRKRRSLKNQKSEQHLPSQQQKQDSRKWSNSHQFSKRINTQHGCPLWHMLPSGCHEVLFKEQHSPLIAVCPERGMGTTNGERIEWLLSKQRTTFT